MSRRIVSISDSLLHCLKFLISQEIRDMIYSELNNDVEGIKAEFSKVTDDVYRIRSGFNALTSGKVGGAVGLIPLLDLLTKAVKKKKT